VNVNWERILPIQGEVLVFEDDPTLRQLTMEIAQEIGAKVSALNQRTMH
jgi:hypothetical protein